MVPTPLPAAAAPHDTVGLDLHKRASQLCSLAAAGTVPERRIATTPPRCTATLGGRAPARVLLGSKTDRIDIELRARQLVRLGAAKAAELQALGAASVGVRDPLDAAAVAVRTFGAHAEHLCELLAPDAATEVLLGSCPGVGVDTARTDTPLAWPAEAPPVARLRGKDGADKLVALIGIDAPLEQSGASAGRVRTSKRGNRYLRRSLRLAAETAARTDPQCCAILAKHHAKGKHDRVGVSHASGVSVARELVHILYAVLTHEWPYTLPLAYAPTPDPAAEVLVGP